MPNRFFKSIGLIPYTLHNETNLLKYRLLLLLFVCSFTNVVLLVLGECIYICKTFGSFKNFVEAVSVTLCIGFIFLALAKVSVVFCKRDKLSRLMTELESMFPKNDQEVRVCTMCLSIGRKLCFWWNFMQSYKWSWFGALTFILSLKLSTVILTMVAGKLVS